MELFFHKYKLNFLSGGDAVEGVLLKSSQQGSTGYAGLQPWPQFGDRPLQDQLQSLKQETPTELAKQSLRAIEIDRQARDREKSALDSSMIPASHFLLRTPQEAENIPLLKVCGFTHVKCKFLPDVELLERYDVVWRVDPNSSLDRDQLLSWWKGLSSWAQSKIEFIEDPCPYDSTTYQWLAERLPLAIDWHFREWAQEPFTVKALILKPATQDVLSFADRMAGFCEKLVVTSSLDHPLGQCYAAHQAAKLKEEFPRKTGVCGLNSHSVFVANEFSKIWAELGAEFRAPLGRGFGFSELLESLEWKCLATESL